MQRIYINRDMTVPFITKDKSEIRELISPRDSAAKNFSLAEASVKPHGVTEFHQHRTSEEVYFVLEGSGVLEFYNKETGKTEHYALANEDAVFIEPGKFHRIVNNEDIPLRFLCICSPAYTHADTEMLSMDG